MIEAQSDVRPTFSGLLRGLRCAAGLTQEELAERAGLSARGLRKLERGDIQRPYRRTVEMLVDALELDAEQAEALFHARTDILSGESKSAPKNRPEHQSDLLTELIKILPSELIYSDNEPGIDPPPPSATYGPGSRIIKIIIAEEPENTSNAATVTRFVNQFDEANRQLFLNSPWL